MMTNRPSGRSALRAGPVACLALLVSACMADGVETQASQPAVEIAAAQPPLATYDCGEDGTITVENMHTAVRLVEGAGDSYDLPASPPTQTSRFGEGSLALVVEGGEALWMKAGREPMTCRR